MSILNTQNLPNFYMNSTMSLTNQFGPSCAEASQYLTKSITGMIKNQLKTYRLHKKLEKQLQDHRKNKQKKEFICELHKVQNFRNNQNQNYRKKYEEFAKLKKQKEDKIQSLLKRKQQQIKAKTIFTNKKLFEVKKRHDEAVQQEISTRLSRVQSIQHLKSTQKSLKIDQSKINSRCTSSQNYRMLIKQRSESQQQFRITNYFKKIKNAESRIIQRQIKNEGRKIKSIQTSVKKLTSIRDTAHQNLMKRYEDNFNSKMSSFYSNIQQVQLQNSSFMMNKSMMRSKLRQNVLKKKQMNQSQTFKKTITNYMKKANGSQKQNMCHWNNKKLDLLRSQSNFMANSIKMQTEKLQEDNERNMRVVYLKVKKLKLMQDNQKVSQKQKEQILSLINQSDPQYQQIVQFLSCTKDQFLKKQIEKEQEKLNKMKKTGRNNKIQKS